MHNRAREHGRKWARKRSRRLGCIDLSLDLIPCSQPEKLVALSNLSSVREISGLHTVGSAALNSCKSGSTLKNYNEHPEGNQNAGST
jgi:hypothetical protein